MDPSYTHMADSREIVHQLIGTMVLALEESNQKSIGSNAITSIHDFSVAGNKEFMIIGWIFRTVFSDLQLLKRLDSDKNYSKVFKEIISSLKKMDEHVDTDPIIIAPFFENYFEIKNIIRNSIFTEKERGIIKVRPEFAKEFSIELIDLLDKNRSLLSNKGNDMVGSILNEIYRSSHTYGGKETLILSMVFLALDRYNDFFRYELELEEDLDKKLVLYQTKMEKYIDLVCELRQKMTSGKIEELYDCANSILIKLGIECRNLFIIYGDNPNKERNINENKIDLPEDAKNKLSEAIAKSLDKELR